MILLRVLEVMAILSALWAVWVRRDSLHSAPDAPITIAIALFAAGAFFDSAWPTLGAASLPITGTAISSQPCECPVIRTFATEHAS